MFGFHGVINPSLGDGGQQAAEAVGLAVGQPGFRGPRRSLCRCGGWAPRRPGRVRGVGVGGCCGAAGCQWRGGGAAVTGATAAWSPEALSALAAWLSVTVAVVDVACAACVAVAASRPRPRPWSVQRRARPWRTWLIFAIERVRGADPDPERLQQAGDKDTHKYLL